MTRKQKTVTKVLKLRGLTREQLNSEVNKALHFFNLEKEKLDCLEEEFRVHLDEFSRKQGRGAIGVREMNLFYMYFEHLCKLVVQQKKCVLVRQSELNEKQRAMHEAQQELRLMEILHNKNVHEEMQEIAHGDRKAERGEPSISCAEGSMMKKTTCGRR